MINKQALLDAVKEFLRVVVLAIIPILITGIESGAVDWRIILTVGLLAGLRFVDKYLHLIGKEQSTAKGESVLLKGLTRF